MSSINLNQKITLWKITGENGSGGSVYSAPVTVDGKYALVQERFTSLEGEQVLSKAVFYTEAEVVPNEFWVVFGESTDSEPPADAEMVRAIKQNPSMFGDLKKGLV